MSTQAELALQATRHEHNRLTWRRSSKYHLVSDCGRYSVAKVIVNSIVRYESWRRSPDQLLATHDDAEHAQRRCQEHADASA